MKVKVMMATALAALVMLSGCGSAPAASSEVETYSSAMQLVTLTDDEMLASIQEAAKELQKNINKTDETAKVDVEVDKNGKCIVYVKTLFRIWDEKPNLDMTVGFMELSVPEEVMGKGKAGDYMMSVRASGSRNPFGTMEYKATVSLFRDCFRIGTFDYPFIDDNLKSLTGDADVSENWARLFDYVRFAKPVDAAKNQQTGRVIA